MLMRRLKVLIVCRVRVSSLVVRTVRLRGVLLNLKSRRLLVLGTVIWLVAWVS